jgi:hypothetical protein
MPRVRVAIVAGLVVLGAVTVLAVRSPGEPRRDPHASPTPSTAGPSTAGPSTAGSPGTGSTALEERSVTAPPDITMSTLRMSFGSADTGYGLFSQCDNGSPRRCTSALLVTLDGGQSWVVRQLPEHGESALWMQVVDASTIVLFADDTTGTAWVSHDSARTFQRRPRFPPPAETVPDGWAAGCPEKECVPQVYEYRSDGPHRLATQPPLRSPLQFVRFDGARLWAGAISPNGVPELVVSGDRGRTWKPSDPLVRTGVGSMEVTVSPERRDVWLVQRTDNGLALARFDPAAGTGRGAWRPVPPPDEARGGIAAVALGNGELAVTTYNSLGYLVAGGTRWLSPPPERMPGRIFGIGMLRDGTVEAVLSEQDDGGNALLDIGGVLLGVGAGTNRHWIHVKLVPVLR